MRNLCLRVGTQLISRRVLDALIKCGAFDSTGIARAGLIAEADNAIRIAQSDVEKNQIGLFCGAVKVARPLAREPSGRLSPAASWTLRTSAPRQSSKA
jgi:DNA polymerase-3 subunit alpha